MISLKKHLFFIILFCHFLVIGQTKKVNIDSLYNQIKQLSATPEKVDRLLELNRASYYQRPDFAAY